jgi:diguanylate cyclase (GGDEF)-like protein
VINDRHGHTAGDRVLVGAAERLLASVVEQAVAGIRDDAVVARVGGEEFGFLLRAGRESAMELAEEALGRVRSEPIDDISVTASAGVATAARPMDASKLYHQSDEAMFAAKAGGRDRVFHFSDLERAALAGKRDLALEGFQNRTRVITERAAEVIARRGRRLMEELRAEADLDRLTGLFSRRYLDRRLAFDFEVASEEGSPLIVALLDVDHFGHVNKDHGWPTGDRVLAEIGNRVRAHVRASDWVARYGGEEICIVMHELSDEDAANVLERLRVDVADVPFPTRGKGDLVITVSIGAARRVPTDTDVEALIERVSAQLLDAKNAGRNCVRFARGSSPA